MNIEGRRIWQVAAGDTIRSYPDMSLAWDVILNGPGHVGRWPECLNDLRAKLSVRKVADIERFFNEVGDGDIVVLRLGTQEIHGVGVVVGNVSGWNEAFADVDGWDLQFLRRVRWVWRSDVDGEQGRPQRFAVYTLRFGATVQEMTSNVVMTWLRGLVVEDGRFCRAIRPLPGHEEVKHVEVGEIGEYLFDQGVAARSVDDLVREMGELTRVAKWYARSSTPTSEHETVAYLVVPLLRALGWTPQRMAIEWNRVDIALFARLPRDNEALAICVEAKRRDESLLSATSQAVQYVEANGGAECRRIIVTDGIRYGVHVRQPNEGFSRYPQAYLNLTDMRRRYPIYDSAGAEEALLYMSPQLEQAAARAPEHVRNYPEEV